VKRRNELPSFIKGGEFNQMASTEVLFLGIGSFILPGNIGPPVARRYTDCAVIILTDLITVRFHFFCVPLGNL
jgi:hypothetical protein